MARLLTMACLALAACCLSQTASAQTAGACKRTADAAYEKWVANPALERCAAQGNTDAEVVLGMLHWSASDAKECETPDCDPGDPAYAGLSPSLRFADMQKEGFRYLEAAASKGDTRAQNELGLAYMHALYGLPEDPAKALQWLTRSAEAGDLIGAYNLARIYFAGFGVERSVETGERYLRMSAEHGYEPARCSLNIYLERKPSVEARVESGVRQLRENLSGVTCDPDEIMLELF